MNKPLTAEEAKNLTFPCLLEVWDILRANVYTIVTHINQMGRFAGPCNAWQHAALPSPEITEAMRKQFAPACEYPKRMLVWDCVEEDAEPRIVLADLGEKAKRRYIVVYKDHEPEFQKGGTFYCVPHNHAKPIPAPDPIAQEIAELRQRIADLEAKHNQQS